MPGVDEDLIRRSLEHNRGGPDRGLTGFGASSQKENSTRREPPCLSGAPATSVGLVVAMQTPHLAPVVPAQRGPQRPRRLGAASSLAGDKLHAAQEAGG